MTFRFGTVGSPVSTPRKPGGSVGGILRAAELGLDALELAWVQSVRASGKTCAAIRKAAEERGLALSVHAPYFINLNAKDAAILESSRERLMKAARAGYAAGATDIIFHAGGYMGEDPEAAFETIRSRLEEIAEQLRNEGTEVVLRPETLGKSAQFGTLEEVVELSRVIEGVAPCIDFAHLHARAGDGSFNSYREFSDALSYVRKRLGGRALKTMHIHLSGIEYGPKGEKRHLVLRESDLAYTELLQALIDAGAEGRILCESPVLEEDALLLRKEFVNLITQR